MTLVAIHQYEYGVNVYPFTVASECLDGLAWKDENKMALAEYLGFEYHPQHGDKLTILELPLADHIPANAAAQIWAADDIG